MNIQHFFEPLNIRKAVLGFTGWSDAGSMAQQVLDTLRNSFPCELIASWDLDGFWHTESARPRVSIRHGHIQKMNWPAYRFFAITPPAADSVLLGIGMEPSLHWKTFTRELLEQLAKWGCEEIVLLGSLFDQIFYDEVVISGIVQDTEAFNLLRELGCQRIEYEGPCAVHASIMEEALATNMRAFSLWCHLPFYLKCPHELILARYLRIVGQVLKIPMDTHILEEKWQDRLKEIESLVGQDQELQQLVQSIKEADPLPTYGGEDSSCKVIQLDEFIRRRQDPPLRED